MKAGLYFHAGSKNHGCEAIVRATISILGEVECELYSIRKEDDLAYELEDSCPIFEDWLSRNHTLKWLWLSLTAKLGLLRKEEKQHYATLHGDFDLALSIGGDNYCYRGQPKQLAYLNQKLKKQGKKTVLWGCSIDPELLEDASIVEDLQQYDLITVRESLTKEALNKAGISDCVKQFADPAFSLKREDLPLPNGFQEGNTIGINVSPLIFRYEEKSGAALENYRALIRFILQETDCQVALIPHVVMPGNDDREPLKTLYNEFSESGRVILIEDCNCMQLKGFIARCRFFVGARTHATIAAYSTKVPTLVVGYSVKARGIARDLFGAEEHYVLPVQKLKEENQLVEEFKWLFAHEQEIRSSLDSKMDAYIDSARKAGEAVKGL